MSLRIDRFLSDCRKAVRVSVPSAAALVFAMLMAGSALAQTVPGLGPRPEESGRPPLQPRAAPEVRPPAAPETRPPISGDIRFVLRDVALEGVTVFPPEKLRPTYQNYVGQTVSLEVLAEIEAAVTKFYREAGYILARAIIPAGQSLDPAGAVLRVQVFEGYIDRVLFQDSGYTDGSRSGQINDLLNKISTSCRGGDRPLPSGKCPLHKDVLERYLLLAGDLPGVNVNAVLQPAPNGQGGADLFITTLEDPFEASIRVDNRGSKFVGPYRAEGTMTLNSLFGIYDRTKIRYQTATTTNELQLIDIGEDIPIWTEGTRAAIAFNYTKSEPGSSLRQSGFTSENKSLLLAVTHPFIRSRGENLQTRAFVGGRNAEGTVYFPTQVEISKDQTRYFGLGATYDLADRFLGVSLVDVEFQRGIKGLGAETKPGSRVDGRLDYALVKGEIQRLQRVLSDVNLLVALQGQYSFTDLLSSQEFAYGGERFGRAYDSGELVGDHGLTGLIELQYNVYGSTEDVLRNAQAYLFYDRGKVWNSDKANGPLPYAAGLSSHDTGESIGVGIRFNLDFGISGYAEVAKPLNDRRASYVEAEDNKDWRAFFALGMKF